MLLLDAISLNCTHPGERIFRIICLLYFIQYKHGNQTLLGVLITLTPHLESNVYMQHKCNAGFKRPYILVIYWSAIVYILQYMALSYIAAHEATGVVYVAKYYLIFGII